MLNRIETYRCEMKRENNVLVRNDAVRPHWMVVSRHHFSPAHWRTLRAGDHVRMQYQEMADGTLWVPIDGGRYAELTMPEGSGERGE